MEHLKALMLEVYYTKYLMLKFLLVGFLLGYAFSFVSQEWYMFFNLHFIKFCRWAELPDYVWLFMDRWIFFGAL